MLEEKMVNGDYTHLIKIKVKKTTALIVINEQLKMPIVKTTMVANAKRVKKLVESKAVPEKYLDAESKNQEQSYSFKFLILLMAYLKETDRKKTEGYSPIAYGSKEITGEMLDRVDLGKLQKDLKEKIPVLGKNLANYFALENIKIGKSTMYTLCKIYPELPTMEYGRTYTPEEIDIWRQFLLNRTYKHHLVREKEVAI